MKRTFTIYLGILCWGIGLPLQATHPEPEREQKYWIFLTDKIPSEDQLSHPQKFLSETALERRKRSGIPVHRTDLPVSAQYIEQLLDYPLEIQETSRWFNAVSITVNQKSVLDELRQRSFVKKIRPVRRWRFVKPPSVNPVENPDIPTKRSSTTFPYGEASNQVRMMEVDTLHQLGYTGKGVTIAVLDAGFFNADSMAAFDSLRQNDQIRGYYDFVDDDTTIFHGSVHGTHVLSTMGAYLPDQIVGTAPRADYWLFRTENTGHELIIEEDNWVAGAEYADSVGADIITSSLGYSQFQVDSTSHTYQDLDGNTTLVTRGADMAARKGILVVNSAGNEGNRNWQHVIAPADGDSVLAVGATSKDGFYVNFSSKGPTSDGRLKPNVSAQGYKTVVGYYKGGIAKGSGTSFSAPLVSGAAASLWQAHPNTTNMEIYEALQQTASQNLAPDNRLGYGIPDLWQAYRYLKDTAEVVGNTKPRFFPNPFRDQLNIHFYAENEQKITLTFYDMTGRFIARQQKHLRADYFYRFSLEAVIPSLDLEKLSKGCYIVTIQKSGQRYVEKVVKI